MLFESLANGVLPMASYFSGLACGINELEGKLGPEVAGLMKIPVDDPERVPALAAKLNTLLATDAPAEVSPRLRRIAEEDYDWRARARQMVAAFGRFAPGLTAPGAVRPAAYSVTREPRRRTGASTRLPQW